MSDVSDMASFDGCRSKMGQWTTYRIQASHSSIALKHRIQASHSTIALTDIRHNGRGSLSGRSTANRGVRDPKTAPISSDDHWPSQRGGLRTRGGSEYTGMPIRVISRTNQRNRGRTSADRSTKATLMLTVPRSLIKSSTKDLT